MSVTIRVARNDEIETARQLTNRSWRATYGPLIGASETEGIIADRHSSERFTDQAARAGHVFLVAERDGEIVGHCHAYPDNGLYIDRLHVEPGLKRGGIGRAMLNDVDARAPAGTRLWLEVLEGNDSAIAFYRSMGFAEFRRTDACGGLAGIPALHFEKAGR